MSLLTTRTLHAWDPLTACPRSPPKHAATLLPAYSIINFNIWWLHCCHHVPYSFPHPPALWPWTQQAPRAEALGGRVSAKGASPPPEPRTCYKTRLKEHDVQVDTAVDSRPRILPLPLPQGLWAGPESCQWLRHHLLPWWFGCSCSPSSSLACRRGWACTCMNHIRLQQLQQSKQSGTSSSGCGCSWRCGASGAARWGS